MIAPQIRSIDSVEVFEPLKTWQPKEAAFSVDLEVFIGPAGTDVEERFTLYVCSPAWLEKSLSVDGLLDGRHMLIVKRFDYFRIRAWIDSVLERSTGADWDEVAGKLGRYFDWEFEEGSYVVDPNPWSPGKTNIDKRISDGESNG